VFARKKLVMLKQLFLFQNSPLDFIDYATDTRHNVAGCKPYHLKIVVVQPSRSTRIVKRPCVFGMMVAINFHNKAYRKTAKIGEIWPKRKLATESVAMNGFAPQVTPKILLSS